MAQADQVVQNAQFPAFRTDVNDNLAALFSQSSGPSAPSVTVAGQPWVDTSSNPPVWKVRNASNNGWITIGVLDATFRPGGVTPVANGGTGATTAAAGLAALLPSQTGQAGKALVTDGSLAFWGTVAAGASCQVFSTAGSFNYVPTAGKTTFLVIVTGGGGGGGSTSGSSSGAASGGGAGATAIRCYTAAEMGSSAAITVGAGGAPVAASAGSSGGNSVFTPSGSGLALTANGGGGGSTQAGVRTGGLGGTATNGQLNLTGGFGCILDFTTRRVALANLAADGGAAGGQSFWGFNFGQGGFGAYSSAVSQVLGTAGTAGVIVVLEW